MEHTQNKVGVYATGANPVCSEGEKFIAETNRWFPLWMYITYMCEDLLSVEESNMGFFPKHLKTFISEKHAIKMAERILKEIESGETAKFGQRMFSEDETFTFSVDDAKAFANFCGLSGGFSLS